MKLYVVRNKEGKFFRNKGYGGYGQTWRDSLEEAKFYSKIGPAKGQVTFFYKNYPKYGCPEILEFELQVEKAKIINMEELTTKSIKKIKTKEKKRRLDSLRYELEYYSKKNNIKLEDIKKEIDKLTNEKS